VGHLAARVAMVPLEVQHKAHQAVQLVMVLLAGQVIIAIPTAVAAVVVLVQ
jgi:hypothetical protein